MRIDSYFSSSTILAYYYSICRCRLVSVYRSLLNYSIYICTYIDVYTSIYFIIGEIARERERVKKKGQFVCVIYITTRIEDLLTK